MMMMMVVMMSVTRTHLRLRPWRGLLPPPPRPTSAKALVAVGGGGGVFSLNNKQAERVQYSSSNYIGYALSKKERRKFAHVYYSLFRLFIPRCCRIGQPGQHADNARHRSRVRAVAHRKVLLRHTQRHLRLHR
eukprot:COSAG06_NODE_735_length_12697_cov_9.204398_15_plen_133_part_00